jgi:hypothetical protein
MTHDPDAIFKVALEAMCKAAYLSSFWNEGDEAWRVATAIVAAITPLIRAEALEEAAKVADDEDGEYSYAGEHRNMAMLQQCCREIAAAIRALKVS